MSQLVRLEGKHIAQTEHRALKSSGFEDYIGASWLVISRSQFARSERGEGGIWRSQAKN